jgi:tetratricopeptide (TPR) repeat protein
MADEAEFAMKQAFALCPYSPEPVYHLIVLYSTQNRLEDLRLILQTAQKLDPHNGQFNNWLGSVVRSLDSQKQVSIRQELNRAQELAAGGKMAEAESTLDAVAQDPQTDVTTLLETAVRYAALGKPAKGVAIARKLTETYSGAWQIWYSLARLEALDGKAAEAAAALGKAFAINPSDQVTNANQQPANFHEMVRQDKSFDAIRQSPEFQKVMQTNR